MPHPPIEDWREILIVAAAARRGLFAGLRPARSAAQLAAELDLDRRAVRITCGALTAMGYLEPAGERLALTARGLALVEPTAGADPLAAIQLGERAIRNHLALGEVLAGGPPPDDVSDGDLGSRRRFARAMNAIAAPRVAAAVAGLGPPPPGGRLLDLGGAPGAYARGFAAAGWRVTVADRPAMLEATGRELAADGIATVAADAAAEVPAGPWQAIYLGNLLHLFDAATAAAVVAGAGAALSPGGLLAIQEMLPGRAPQAERFAVMMLVGTAAGEVHAEADYARWMTAAGCSPGPPVDVVDAEHQLMIGRRR